MNYLTRFIDKGINIIDYLIGKASENYADNGSDIRILEEMQSHLEGGRVSPKYREMKVGRIESELLDKLDKRNQQMVFLTNLQKTRNKLTRYVMGE